MISFLHKLPLFVVNDKEGNCLGVFSQEKLAEQVAEHYDASIQEQEILEKIPREMEEEMCGHKANDTIIDNSIKTVSEMMDQNSNTENIKAFLTAQGMSEEQQFTTIKAAELLHSELEKQAKELKEKQDAKKAPFGRK